MERGVIKDFCSRVEFIFAASKIYSMRLFVAVDLNENVRRKLSQIQKELGSGGFDLKLVEPENLHLTLKFLGEVEESTLESIDREISESVKGFHEFALHFEGIGYFGSERFVKVVWVGVKEGKEDFIKLAESLDKGLSFIRKDEHEKSPHLTIARVKSGRNVQELAREVKALRDVKVGEVLVKEIKLKKSVLTPDGPIYSDVKVFPLVRKEGAVKTEGDQTREGVRGHLQASRRLHSRENG